MDPNSGFMLVKTPHLLARELIQSLDGLNGSGSVSDQVKATLDKVKDQTQSLIEVLSCRNNRGESPISHAIQLSANRQEKFDQTAFGLMINKVEDPVKRQELLKSVNSANQSALHIAVKTGNQGLVTYVQSLMPQSLLASQLDFSDHSLMSTIIQYSANPDLTDPSGYQGTVFGLVINSIANEFERALLVKSADKNGHDALYFAVQTGDLDLVKYVMSFATTEDWCLHWYRLEDKDTPLHAAAGLPNNSIILSFFLTHPDLQKDIKAIASYPNRENKTPLDLAVNSSNKMSLFVELFEGLEAVITVLVRLDENGKTRFHNDPKLILPYVKFFKSQGALLLFLQKVTDMTNRNIFHELADRADEDFQALFMTILKYLSEDERMKLLEMLDDRDQSPLSILETRKSLFSAEVRRAVIPLHSYLYSMRDALIRKDFVQFYDCVEDFSLEERVTLNLFTTSKDQQKTLLFMALENLIKPSFVDKLNPKRMVLFFWMLNHLSGDYILTSDDFFKTTDAKVRNQSEEDLFSCFYNMFIDMAMFGRFMDSCDPQHHDMVQKFLMTKSTQLSRAMIKQDGDSAYMLKRILAADADGSVELYLRQIFETSNGVYQAPLLAIEKRLNELTSMRKSTPWCGFIRRRRPAQPLLQNLVVVDPRLHDHLNNVILRMIVLSPESANLI